MARVEYVHCPLCGWNRPLHTRNRGDRRFEVKLDFVVIETREGGGRGVGFSRVDGAGVAIADLPASDPSLYQNLLQQTRILLKALEEAGG